MHFTSSTPGHDISRVTRLILSFSVERYLVVVAVVVKYIRGWHSVPAVAAFLNILELVS